MADAVPASAELNSWETEREFQQIATAMIWNDLKRRSLRGLRRVRIGLWLGVVVNAAVVIWHLFWPVGWPSMLVIVNVVTLWALRGALQRNRQAQQEWETGW